MTEAPRSVLAVVAGLVAGVVLAVGFWLVVRPSSDPPPATAPTAPAAAATTTTTTGPATWVSPFETRLGPSVVVPSSLEVQGGQLVVGYDVFNVTASGPPTAPPEGLGAPDRWTLVTAEGEFTARAISPVSRSVRFNVGDGFAVEQIEEIRVDSYRIASPIDWPLPISQGEAEPRSVATDLEFRLVQLIEQADNWLVIVESDADGALLETVTVDGVGRDWVSSSVSMLGTARWTLDFRGQELPDPLPLVVRGLAWIEVERPAVLDLTGVIE